jgi:hypothetical protein
VHLLGSQPEEWFISRDANDLDETWNIVGSDHSLEVRHPLRRALGNVMTYMPEDPSLQACKWEPDFTNMKHADRFHYKGCTVTRLPRQKREVREKQSEQEERAIIKFKLKPLETRA